jgi:arabinofuranosyltransferase
MEEMRSDGSSRTARLALVVLLVLVGLVAAVLVWRSSFPTVEGRRGFCLFDDAMISLRYAANLAQGQGLVWNPGQRVEGFTNPLMVFVMAAAVAGAGPWYAPLVVQIFGIAILLLTLGLVAALGRRDGMPHPGAALAATAAAAAFYPLTYWSIMGMETGLLTLLLLVAFLADARDLRGERRHLRMLLVSSSALALLTRPDAALFLGVLFAARGLRGFRGRWRPVLLESALALVPMMAYVGFRRLYYGQWLANVYYLKLSGLPLGQRMRDGLAFCRNLWPAITLAGMVALGWVMLRRRGREAGRAPGFAGPALLIFALTFAYQVLAGGDAWPPYWRFTVPAQVLLLAAAATTAAQLHDTGLLGRRACTGLLVGLVVLVAADSLRLYRDLSTLVPWTADHNYQNSNTGMVLRRLTTEKATVAAYWAGAIPYYAQRVAIDPLGKMDPAIARGRARGSLSWGGMQQVPGHNKLDLGQSLVARRPTFIQWSNLACDIGGPDLRAWCEASYVLVKVAGKLPMLLLKGSPDVHWEMLSRGRP